jgi:hypothetical protein
MASQGGSNVFATSPQPDRPALFPGFFLGGFECATQIDKSRRRQDYVILTQHEQQVREDYERVRSVGIRCVREGLRWHLCDRGGRYDFSSIAPMVDAALETGICHINCLYHYGCPDDLEPLDSSFVSRFRDYAAAFAEWRIQRVPGPRWYATVNEPSMFAYAAGEAGWFAPFLRGKGRELKIALLKAGFAGMDAIRAIDPEARFVSVDPLLHVVPPKGQPERAEEAERRNQSQYEFWDMLCGRAEPELGGGTGYLDVIGVNYYPDTQTELDSDDQLPLDDPRRKPFREMLAEVYDRYRRPIIVAETSARGHERAPWFRQMIEECLAARRQGVDLQAVCIYPLVDMPEWKYGVVGPLGHLGFWDVVREGDALRRVVNHAYRAELEWAQRQVADELGLVAPGQSLTLIHETARATEPIVSVPLGERAKSADTQAAAGNGRHEAEPPLTPDVRATRGR